MARKQATQIADALKPTNKVSYFRIFVATLFLGPPYVIGTILAARHFLLPDDVDWIRSALSAAFGLALTGSGGATIYGGLAKTLAKIALQKATGLQAPPDQSLDAATDDEGAPDEAPATNVSGLDVQNVAQAAASEAISQFVEKFAKKAVS